MIAYIGLGSNLGDPIARIQSARESIHRFPGVRELAFSSLYRSPPMGPPNQPDYVNAVMGVETCLTAPQLLAALQKIEADHGRVRTRERWGPRTLDLDLLLFGDQIIETDDLIVPHVGIGERSFVLYPLAEIAGHLVVPGKGLVTDLMHACGRRGLERIHDGRPG